MECETCSLDLEVDRPNRSGTVTGPVHTLFLEVQTTRWRTSQARRWSGCRASCQLISASLSSWVESGAFETCPVAQGDDVWVGLTPDDDVYPEDLHCRRPDGGPRLSGPPESTRLAVYSLALAPMETTTWIGSACSASRSRRTYRASPDVGRPCDDLQSVGRQEYVFAHLPHQRDALRAFGGAVQSASPGLSRTCQDARGTVTR